MVIIRDDPAAAARLLADELDAELAIGGAAATEAVALLHADPVEAPVDLAQLSIAMRRAERVRDRTRARAAQHLARSFNTELAIHPDTLHRAATELGQIVAERQRAERGRPPAGPVLGRTARSVLGVVVSGGILLAAMGRWSIGTALLVAGLLGVVVAHLTVTRRMRAKLPGLDVQQASARRRWEQLAGVGADPNDVEAVIFRYDPRQRMVADLVGHHPAVRAAERAARVHRTAWVQAWCAAVGDPYQAPEADELDLSDPGETPATAAHDESKAAVLVMAAPYADLTDDEARDLHHRLLTLPEGPRVIVVLGPDSRVDQITTLDLTSPGPTVDLTDATIGAVEGADGATPAMSDSEPDAAATVDQLNDDPQPQVR